jgi:tetratricopeptide (TPR) repeat protein
LVAPALVVALGILLALALLRPPGWIVIGVVLLLFLPGRWWRWRTRRFRRGLRLLRRGEPEGAAREMEAFLAGVRADPNFAQAQPYFNLGRTYPYEAAAHSNLGVVRLRRGDPGAALDSFRAALEVAPEWVQAWYGQAVALRLEGSLPASEAATRRALELRPTYLAARLLLALVLREQGKDGEVEAVLEPLAAEGKDPEALLVQLAGEWLE